MKIGVFDSGLGGLIVLKNIVKELPKYDYVYLGDTLHMPYGKRSQAEIYKFTRKALEYLFKQDCKLVILACNTASSRALRKIQREFLPKYYPDRKVLGVIIPTAEAAMENKAFKNLGILGTKSTVNSRSYIKEINKIKPKTTITQSAATELATAIEIGNNKFINKLVAQYVKPFVKKNPDSLILACTHYSVIKPIIKKNIGKRIKIIDQTEIIPKKLSKYLAKHTEINKNLSTKRGTQLYITKLTKQNSLLAKKWFGNKAKLNLVKIK